jgi:hypothetical protein
MRPEGWTTPVVIDLGGVKMRSPNLPALRQHDQKRVVGHITRLKADRDGIHVAGVCSGPEGEVSEVVGPARKGFPWQMSIGADPKRTRWVPAGESVQVNGRTVDGPVTIAEETEIGEVSFVAVGADPGTSVSIAAQYGRAKGETVRPVIAAGYRALLSGRASKIRSALKGLLRAGKGKDTSAPPGMGHYSDDEIDRMSSAHARAALKRCMRAMGEDVEEDEDDVQGQQYQQREEPEEDREEDDRGGDDKGDREKRIEKVEASKRPWQLGYRGLWTAETAYGKRR